MGVLKNLLKPGHFLHAGILTAAMGIYGSIHWIPSPDGPNRITESLPSFLFPLACFSVVALLPLRLGGNGGRTLRSLHVWAGTLFAVIIFEGAGPRFGFGTADILDALALIVGSLFYSLLSYLAKQRGWA